MTENIKDQVVDCDNCGMTHHVDELFCPRAATEAREAEVRRLSFFIEEIAPTGEDSFLVLRGPTGQVKLDGRGSLHGQVQRGVSQLDLPIAIVDDYLDEGDSTTDFNRWMRERAGR